MLVKNLTPWSGQTFAYRPGDHIDLPDEVAKARIAAGLAAEPDAGSKAGDNAQELKKIITQRDGEIALLKKQIAESADAKALADARSEADDLRAQLQAAAAKKK